MVSVVAFDRKKAERERIRESCWEQISKYPDEDMNFVGVGDSAGLREKAGDGKDMSLLYYEFARGQDVAGIREIRRGHGETMIMLMTEALVSPTEYLKPGVAPDSILIKPYTNEELRRTNEEFIRSYMEKNSEDNGKSFLIETKGERILLPYSHIHYFEAREKKTFVRAGMTEYSLFKTLGILEEELPAQFRRCHRSYIVNTSKLRRVNLSENYLDLGDGIEVPVSKTYKQEFRKLLET